MFEKHEELVQQGYLSKSELDDLVLYNYTDKCTFDNHWNDITLNSRGTIYDKTTGKVVFLALPKFFNLNQRPEVEEQNLPDLPFQVFEKVDGSWGTLYRHNGEFKIATRGSFYSEQAIKATEMLKKHDLSELSDNITLLFEIIYPENKIIVDYGQKEELVLLTAMDTDTLEELTDYEVNDYANRFGFRRPLTFNISKIQYIKKAAETLSPSQEGWVIRYSNGLRLKIKGQEYMKLAKFKYYMSPLSVWEALKEGKIEERLAECPDEFHEELRGIVKKLRIQYHLVFGRLNDDMAKRCLMADETNKETRKCVAQDIGTFKPPYKNYYFAMLSKNFDVADEIIYNIIEPKSNKFVGIEEIFQK